MTPKDNPEWTMLDAIFTQALSHPEGERLAWLREKLSDDPDALDRVISLLQQEERSRTHFDRLLRSRDQVAEDLVFHLDDVDEDPRIGAHYGPWLILRRIAAGGLSVVYEARRDDGRYDQSVALKVIRGGMHKGEGIRHFLRERRILSSLDHPAIVRILDGGETATGAPWFVMDLAVGKPIIDYCQEAGLGLMPRLALLADIAGAVQSAHARLVVHRDIKSDNILITDEGHPRLLDFGVSSLVSGEEDDTPGLAMTPSYASPEQLRLEQVTTASDIWQLGRVGQELCEPFDPLPGDVRAVIQKAMAERIEDRYDSAASFAEDLRRVQDGKAPLANPDNRMRAFGRFARRNKSVAGLGLLLILGLAGWALTASIQAHEMERQRATAVAAADRAERGRAVLLDMFRRLDPLERDGVPSTEASADSLVEPTLASVREQLPDDPLLRAELVGWAARIRERSNEIEAARALAQESVDLLKQAGDTSSTDYASALAYLGHLDMLMEKTDQAGPELDAALAIALAAPETDSQAFDAILSAGWAYTSDWQMSRDLMRQALPRALAVGSVNGEIEARVGLGRALRRLGEYEQAEAEFRKALQMAEQAYGPHHPRLALPLSDLGLLLADQGKSDEAIAVHRRATALSIATFGANNVSVLSHRNNLAIALSRAGRNEEAITEMKAILALRKQNFGSDSLTVGETYQNLGVQQAAAGHPEDALASLDKAMPIFMEKVPDGSPQRAFPVLTRSMILLDLHNYAEAEQSAQQAFDILVETLPPGHYATEIARCRIGLAKIGLGDEAAARPFIATSLEALSHQPQAPADYVAPCQAAGKALGLTP